MLKLDSYSYLPLNDGNYKPHDYLKRAVDEMKAYCLPYGHVDIANPETGAIVAIILYMIAKEPAVGRTKLECYTIFLNRIIKGATGHELFTWGLNKKGRIGYFKKIFDYMIENGLILANGSYQFYIMDGTGTKKIIPRLSVMLDKVLPYLNKLLEDYKNITAKEMLKKVNGVILHDGIEYLMLSRVGEQLGLSRMLLLHMCKEGKIEGAIKGSNGLWLIPRSSLKNIHPKVIMRAEDRETTS